MDLQGDRKVDEVKVQVVQLEILQGLIETDWDVLWSKVSTPQLQRQRHEDSVTFNEDRHQNQNPAALPPC